MCFRNKNALPSYYCEAALKKIKVHGMKCYRNRCGMIQLKNVFFHLVLIKHILTTIMQKCSHECYASAFI